VPLRIIQEPDQLRSRPDVVVIGSGIVGLATAFFASREGLSVLIVEAMRSPTSLTSRRSGEGVRAQWELPHNIAIAQESIALYKHFGELVGDPANDAGYRPIGYLYASREPHAAAALKARVERQAKAGLEGIEYLEGAALHDKAPLLAADVIGAAFRGGDGVISIDRIIAGYKGAMDADLVLDTAVHAIKPDAGGVSIESSRGSISAGAVVVAAGAKSIGLFKGFAYAPVMKTAKSSIMRVKAEGIPIDHPTTIDVDIGSFWRPDEGGARITASFSGTLFVEDGVDDPAPEPGYLNHAMATVMPMTPRWKHWSEKLLDSHLRTGTFAVSEDGAPVIGPLPDAPNVYVNGGYSGHGVMMSPGGGRRLSKMLADGRHDPADPFSVERFHDGRKLVPEAMTIHLTDHPN